MHGTYINTILECNSGSQADGHIGAFSPFRKKVYEDLPDKGEFGAFFIGADPFSNQPGQAAFQDSMARISDPLCSKQYSGVSTEEKKWWR